MSRCSRAFIALPFMMGAVVCPLLLANPAAGASLRAQAKTARKACLTGNYEKGVSILADLFVESRNPVHIYNQGRCYEQNRLYQDAIAKFEEYLRLSVNLPQEVLTDTQKHIDECREKTRNERLESQIQPPPPPPPPVPETPTTVLPPEPEPAPQIEATVQSELPPAPGERRWGLITTGIVAGAVGVGGIVTGVVFNLKANDAAKEVNTRAGAYPSKSKDADAFKTYAWIGYGVGAACLAAGVVMTAIGAVRSSPPSSTTTDVAFLPTFAPGQVGAMLTGGF